MVRWFQLAGTLMLACALSHCTPLLEDPPADLVKNATPDTARKQGTPASAPPSALDVTQARKRGWVPRRATPAGDVIEGHAIDITPKALAPEAVSPSLHMPRAPKYTHTVSPAAKVRQPSALPPAALPPPEAVPPVSSGPVHPLLQGGPYGPPQP